MFLNPPKRGSGLSKRQLEALFAEAERAGILGKIQADNGPPGERGADGLPGKDGIDGKDGATGRDGVNGDQGPQGLQGLEGPQGERGEKGERGFRGSRGPKGEDGAPGADAPTDATFITYEDERDTLGRSLQLEAGQGIAIDRTIEGRLRISSFASGGGGVVVQSGSAVEFSGIEYLVQEEQERYWTNEEIVRGNTIIGVRYAGSSVVYIPHDLDIEKIVSIKSESGGSVEVRSY